MPAHRPRREVLRHPGRLGAAGLPDSPGGFHRLHDLCQPLRLPHLPDQGKRGAGGPRNLRAPQHGAVRRHAVRPLAGPSPDRGGSGDGEAGGRYPGAAGLRGQGPADDPQRGGPYEPGRQQRVQIRRQVRHGPPYGHGPGEGDLPRRCSPGRRVPAGGNPGDGPVPVPAAEGPGLGGGEER